MAKKKTPLQILDEWLRWKQLNASDKTVGILGEVRGQVEQLRAQEREGIEHAHFMGFAHSDADITPRQFFELHYEVPPKLCSNCGCPDPVKTYDGHWCKVCHNEMN